jgi:endonuclease-3
MPSAVPVTGAEEFETHAMPEKKQPRKPAIRKQLRGPLAAEAYPNVECALTHRSPWELLVATIFSAQCTDFMMPLIQEIQTA